jgi:type I restriction enzyme R subunit
MRGRGTRKTSKKPVFTMFDFVGVCDWHGDDDTLGGGGLVMEPKKRKRYEPKRLLALDIDDHIDPTTREWITVDENGNMLFPEASEQKKEAVGARFEAWLLAQPGLTAEQERWLRILGSQIRANADTLDEVMPEHFAFFHTFSQMGGVREAQRVFGNAENLQALLDSLNAAVFNEHNDDDTAGDEQRPSAH